VYLRESVCISSGVCPYILYVSVYLRAGVRVSRLCIIVVLNQINISKSRTSFEVCIHFEFKPHVAHLRTGL
jgi:hypothetical protein